ncbi:MAG: hypothetical protein GX660_21730 [Clostridiaceae bacterium]|nr:hypothetical protein [Clostridiaceae bacterium]
MYFNILQAAANVAKMPYVPETEDFRGFNLGDKGTSSTPRLTVEVNNGVKTINGKPVKINPGQQDKHIPGTNNYKQEIANGKPRSILNENPNQLLDNYAGSGQKINDYKERIDFGKTIGQYYDEATGTYTDTSIGIVTYGNKGAHIIPARPK